jgi:hypothetical protein
MKLRETEKTGKYGTSYSATLTADHTVRACNETNLMHYASPIYSVTIPLHVSGLLVAHHQKVTMYICNKWYVLYVLVNCKLAADSQLKRTTYPICRIYSLLPPDDG